MAIVVYCGEKKLTGNKSGIRIGFYSMKDVSNKAVFTSMVVRW